MLTRRSFIKSLSVLPLLAILPIPKAKPVSISYVGPPIVADATTGKKLPLTSDPYAPEGYTCHINPKYYTTAKQINQSLEKSKWKPDGKGGYFSTITIPIKTKRFSPLWPGFDSPQEHKTRPPAELTGQGKTDRPLRQIGVFVNTRAPWRFFYGKMHRL